jgi:beta-1,4-galactosyltransferase 1
LQQLKSVGHFVSTEKDLLRFEGGKIELNFTSLDLSDIYKSMAPYSIRKGGSWSPRNCTSRHNVAILIPYKNRSEYLGHFLLNMHPILIRQQLNYKIYLVEPYGNITFNRGLLFNIGFLEANKDVQDKWDCHAYHDVDLLPEDDHILYGCPPRPTHLAHFISKHNYS